MDFSSKKIIVVDDDPKFIEWVKKILENKGYKVFTCSDLTSTYDLVKEIGPDLIVLDLNLSKKESGARLLLERQSSFELQQIQIIVCSANDRKSVVNKMYDLGASDYILKPIRPDWFLMKVKKALKDKPTILKYEIKPSDGDNTVEVKSEAEVLEIGEANCKLQSAINFNENTLFTINFIHLREYIKPIKQLRTSERSMTLSPGLYDTSCTIIGVSDKEASTLRQLKSSWRTSK